MKKFNRSVFGVAGYNTVSLGTGRKEFNPKKPRPGIKEYIEEAGRGVISQIKDASLIDEGIIGNFMAARFNKQGNLAGFIPAIDPALEYKPCSRVEGACGSGGLAVTAAIKSVLSGMADVVLAMGVEVQNTVKAIYGADILAGAGYFEGERKQGDAYFFPGQFSKRAGAAYEKWGYEKVRKGMAHWYKQAVENARKNPKAQEYHNAVEDLIAVGMTPPNPKAFTDHLNVFDCSKVSDGASALLIVSEQGLDKLGIGESDAMLICGYGQCESNITNPPEESTRLQTTQAAVKLALGMAGITIGDVGFMEVHDCFTITGLLSLEAAGVVGYGEAADYVIAGKTAINGDMPTNATGGLIGFGHYTGGTGVRQAVDMLHQLTGRAGGCQINIRAEKPYGLMINMGGNDKTVVSMVAKRGV